jgi:uncharacterized phage-like protein YoqJ
LTDDFIFDKNKTACFSGHRPEKLPAGGRESSRANIALKRLLYNEINASVDEGFRCFITGLSRGIDLWAGEIVLDLKAGNPAIKLATAEPYRGFTDNYKGRDKWLCESIYDEADARFYISESYNKQCMRARNYFMVDNSSKLIAVLSNLRSGTGQTVRYAEKSGIAVKLFYIDRIEEYS